MGDGVEAISYLQGVEQFNNRELFPYPDLVLLDFCMPRCGGMGVLKFLQRQFHRPRVVLWSNTMERVSVPAALRLGADLVCQKPSRKEELMEIMRRIETKIFRCAPVQGIVAIDANDHCQHAGGDAGEPAHHGKESNDLIHSIMGALMEERDERIAGIDDYFRSFIDSAPLLICLLDAELKGVYFNQQWIAFTGRPQADLLGDQWISDIHSYDRDRCREAWRKATENPQKFELEFRLRGFEGEYHFVSRHRSTPQFSPDGRLQCFINTLLDISARKAAENALNHSEFRRRAVFNSSVGNVAVLDCVGRIIGVNDGWLRFARQQRGKLREVGSGVNYLEVCQRAMEDRNPDAGVAYEGLIRVLDGSLPEFVMEYRCPTPTEELWFEMIVHPLYRQEGGAVVTHLNMTKRHRAELQAQTLLHELAHVSRVAVLGEALRPPSHMNLASHLWQYKLTLKLRSGMISNKNSAPIDVEELSDRYPGGQFARGKNPATTPRAIEERPRAAQAFEIKRSRPGRFGPAP